MIRIRIGEMVASPWGEEQRYWTLPGAGVIRQWLSSGKTEFFSSGG